MQQPLTSSAQLLLPLLLLLTVIITHISCATHQFLWVSDIHYDPLYNGRVNSTHFCRSFQWTEALKQHHAHVHQWPKPNANQLLNLQAGDAKFGRFGCDAPLPLMQSTFTQMKKVNPKPDFLVVSGDFLAHHLPNASFALDTLRFVVSELQRNYPDTTTIPCIGNNDVVPDYSMPFDNSTWLESLYDVWRRWIPLDHQKTSFIRGGYYHVDVSSDLKVVALNSLFYSTRRMPIVAVLPEDPNDQFAWLSAQLRDARLTKKQVIIVSHIPASQNAYDSKELWVPQYLDKYLAIVQQYSDVIVTQLTGHLHTDEFRVQLEPESSEFGAVKSRINVSQGKPVAYGMIASSVSPVFGNNAAFRQLNLEANSASGGFTIANYKQYYMDIFLSNYLSKEVWSFEYEYNQAYNQKGMDAESLNEMLLGMELNSDILTEYVRRRTALFTPDRYKYVCELTRLRRGDYTTCMNSMTNDGVSS